MPKSSIFSDTVRLAPINVCIYCEKKEPEIKLTDEHAIPYSLGGNIVLPKASCTRCADFTKSIEGYVARTIFRDVRIEHNFPTRNPHDRPTELPIYTSISDVENAKPHLVPVKDYPGYLTIMCSEPAGILMGKAPNSKFTAIPFVKAIHPPERVEKLKIEGARRFHLSKFDFSKFNRFIMKISLCATAVEYELDMLDLEVARRIVLKEEPDTHRWVGGVLSSMDAKLGNAPHQMHDVFLNRVDINHIPYLCCQVSLFSYLGVPNFIAVVGPLTPAGVARWMELGGGDAYSVNGRPQNDQAMHSGMIDLIGLLDGHSRN